MAWPSSIVGGYGCSGLVPSRSIDRCPGRFGQGGRVLRWRLLARRRATACRGPGGLLRSGRAGNCARRKPGSRRTERQPPAQLPRVHVHRGHSTMRKRSDLDLCELSVRNAWARASQRRANRKATEHRSAYLHHRPAGQVGSRQASSAGPRGERYGPPEQQRWFYGQLPGAAPDKSYAFAGSPGERIATKLADLLPGVELAAVMTGQELSAAWPISAEAKSPGQGDVGTCPSRAHPSAPGQQAGPLDRGLVKLPTTVGRAVLPAADVNDADAQGPRGRACVHGAAGGWAAPGPGADASAAFSALPPRQEYPNLIRTDSD